MVLSGHLNFKIAVLSIIFFYSRNSSTGGIPEPVVCNEARGQCSKAKHTICHSGWVFRATLFSSNPTTDEGDGDGDDDDINVDAGDHDEVQLSLMACLSEQLCAFPLHVWMEVHQYQCSVRNTYTRVHLCTRPTPAYWKGDGFYDSLLSFMHHNILKSCLYNSTQQKNRVILHHICCTSVA